MLSCDHWFTMSQILYKKSFMTLKADILKVEAVHNYTTKGGYPFQGFPGSK